jgi:hypothetical protein
MNRILFKNIKKEATAHNRSVYASPPVGGSGYGFARSIASLIPTQNLRHILPALAFATQSPYPGWQNVVYSRALYDIWAEICWKIMKKDFTKYF